MKEYWQAPPNQRIKLWRSFRKGLVDLSYTEQLQATVDLWKMAPMSNMTTDIYDHTTWSTPWEYIANGTYDENNIALAMAYTLQLEGYASCEIALVQNTKKSYINLIVIVDNKHVLNYNYGEVNSIDVINNDVTILEKTCVSTLT